MKDRLVRTDQIYSLWNRFQFSQELSNKELFFFFFFSVTLPEYYKNDISPKLNFNFVLIDTSQVKIMSFAFSYHGASNIKYVTCICYFVIFASKIMPL